MVEMLPGTAAIAVHLPQGWGVLLRSCHFPADMPACCLQVEAHSTRAIWLGKPLDLKLEPMRGFDAMVAKKVASGGTAAANEVFSRMVLPGGVMGLLKEEGGAMLLER